MQLDQRETMVPTEPKVYRVIKEILVTKEIQEKLALLDNRVTKARLDRKESRVKKGIQEKSDHKV